MNGMDPNALGYVVVTDYLKANTGMDVSDELQRVIDENPMRTIFFPDGEYILAKPICTSANPEHAVSLQLSTFAILKAKDGWNHSEAMVRLGAKEPFNTIFVNGSNYSLTGGVIDGNMVANGISIDSGRETCIHHTSIKHTVIGIHIKHGANGGSSDADIENVNIVGNSKPDSIGVLIEGYDNTLTNMRIAAVQTGVMIKSSCNFLRNIHPLFTYRPNGTQACEIDPLKSVSFHDYGSTNWYDYCYSDQMATGFRLAEKSKAVLLNCYAMWYSPKGDKELAIDCEGQFNASVTNIRVHFRDDTTNNALLKVGAPGGRGFIENPIINDDLIHDKTYKDYLVGKIVW